MLELIGVRGVIAAVLSAILTFAVTITLTTAIVVVHYEGLPLIKGIPLIGKFASGVIAIRIEAAVTAAKETCAITAQNAAFKAKADVEAESRRQATIIQTEINKRVAAREAAAAQTEEDLDNEIAENNRLRTAAGKDSTCSPPDDATLDLLQRHGFQLGR